MTFGTLTAKGILKRLEYGAILNFQHGGHGSHFEKGLPEITIFL